MSKKEKFNLGTKDIKHLFSRYSILTLNSLDIVLMWVKGYRMDTTDQAFSLAYKSINTGKKEDLDEETDYKKKLADFDLSELDSSLDELSEEELIYLSNLIKDAMSNMAINGFLEKPILPKLKSISDSIDSQLSRLVEFNQSLTDDELKEFFNKYDLMELYAFGTLFEFVYNINLERIERAYYQVVVEKEENGDAKPKNYNIKSIINKVSLLSDKELNFLATFMEDAALYFQTMYEFADMYEITEDFSNDQYPSTEVYNMVDYINNEQKQRLFNPIQKRKGTIA